MRVTHVITRLIVGGAQENTVATVLGLAKIPNVRVDLISGPTRGAEGSLESAFREVPQLLSVCPTLIRRIHPYYDLRAIRELTKTFRATRPEIVHTHSGKAGVLGRIAARRAKIPLVIHTIHGPSFGTFQGGLSNLTFRAAERYAANCTDHFVSVADAMTDQYLAVGIGRREDYSTIRSGFDLEPFLAAENETGLRKQLGLDNGHFIVGKIARLSELKGHEALFEVARKLAKRAPHVRFLLVGDGPLRAGLENRLRAEGLHDHFVFTGLVRPMDVPKFVGIMDALVHLSRREGLPRALPQAMAARKPVVAFDCDGAREVCFNNETGFLIAPDNTDALVDRIADLAADPSLCARLGSTGRAFVKTRFEVNQMVTEIYRLYQRLLSQ